jgi:hypothetical protein
MRGVPERQRSTTVYERARELGRVAIELPKREHRVYMLVERDEIERRAVQEIERLAERVSFLEQALHTEKMRHSENNRPMMPENRDRLDGAIRKLERWKPIVKAAERLRRVLAGDDVDLIEEAETGLCRAVDGEKTEKAESAS